MVVDTTEERCRSILTNILGQKVTTSGVLIKESGHIVNVTGNNDQGTLQTLLLD